jgi:hypothetical protein
VADGNGDHAIGVDVDGCGFLTFDMPEGKVRITLGDPDDTEELARDLLELAAEQRMRRPAAPPRK